jgi:hypothetical protein
MSKNRMKSKGALAKYDREYLERMESIRRKENSFDPSLLADPVATKTGWNSVGSGYTNIGTHKLIEVTPQRLEFRTTIKAYVASAFFLLIGMCFLGHAVKSTSSLLPGVIFFGIGALMMYFGSIPFVFDKREGYMWKGRKKPESDAAQKHSAKKIALIEEVHAIQLLHDFVKKKTRSPGPRYVSTYEMNIVIADGSRVTVVRHCDKANMLKDAEKLSIFLGKPIWNAA